VTLQPENIFVGNPAMAARRFSSLVGETNERHRTRKNVEAVPTRRDTPGVVVGTVEVLGAP
jgi:hypothetical protein